MEGIVVYFKRLYRERQERIQREEEERIFQLNYRFPLSTLPDELLEFIFRYILSNYGLDVFQKLLENVPELQRKVLIVTEREIGDNVAYSPVPRMGVRSYESYLAHKSQQQPLIAFFSFDELFLGEPAFVTYLTRFVDDSPYTGLFNKKCIGVLRAPPRALYGSPSLHLHHSPLQSLKALAKLNGLERMPHSPLAQLPERFNMRGFPLAIRNTSSTFITPRGADRTAVSAMTSTMRENGGVYQLLQEFHRCGKPPESLYLSEFHTELRYDSSDVPGDPLRWTDPSFVQQRHLRILMNENCATDDHSRAECIERRVELGNKASFEDLHIEFLCPKIPLIVDTSGNTEQEAWLTTRNLIIDNLNWTYENPYGRVCQSHADDLDQHSWCLDEREPNVRFGVQCNVMMLIGITDRFLEYSRWRSVTVLYWRRLEPRVRIRDYEEKYPAVIDCPSLTQLKIFSIVRKDANERGHFPQFKVPQLEKLVLVLLKDSEQCWNVKKLLNDQWPKTLRWLTLSSHHKCEGKPLLLDSTGNTIPPDLRHLTTQRIIPEFIDQGPSLRELRYLELDVTAIEPALSGQDKHHRSINIVLNQTRFPSLATLILSVPHKAIDTHDFGTPLCVEVPETCSTVGLALMLSISAVKVNGVRVEFPCGFNNRPTREVFLAFVRDEEGEFVAGEQELMAEYGRPLDTCLEVQWERFGTERRTNE